MNSTDSPAVECRLDGVVGRLVLYACCALAACDVSRDLPITVADVGALAAVCKANGGMKQAERVIPMFRAREWHIECSDGARFVVPA